MRREVVLLVMLSVVAVVAVVASFALAAAPSSPGRTEPPAGILVSVDPSHCYTPNARVPITVTSLTPGSSAQASSEEAVSVTGKASSSGRATLTLLAPAGLPRGRSIEAHLITVEATDATGRPASQTTAFLLAKRSVCELLRRRH